MPDDVCDPESENYDEQKCADSQAAHSESIRLSDTNQAFVSDKPWSDFTAADYTPEQWKAACCLHRAPEAEPKSNHGLPIKEPGGALNRNGVAGSTRPTPRPPRRLPPSRACEVRTGRSVSRPRTC